jgi:hypothetical protein
MAIIKIHASEVKTINYYKNLNPINEMCQYLLP